MKHRHAHSHHTGSAVQTKGRASEAISVPTQPVYRCMVIGSSVRASLLVSTWNQALVTTSPSGSRLAQWKASPPGRMITSVPTKPPVTSAQRMGDTFSLSTVAASTVMASGAIMTMAVNSPTGMYFRLAKANRLLASSRTPRRHWNLGCRVRSTDTPAQRKHDDRGRDGLEGVAEPQRHQQGHRDADELGGGVQHRKTAAGRHGQGRRRPGRSVGLASLDAVRQHFPHRRQLPGQEGQPAQVDVAFAGAVEVAAARGGQAELARGVGIVHVFGGACGCRSRPPPPARRAP